jgi:hypothetical protein
MYGQQNIIYIEMYGQQNITYIELYGQQNITYIEMYGQQNITYIEMYGQQNITFNDPCLPVKNIDATMLTRVWLELEYRIDVCPVARGAHVEHI